MNTNLAQAWIKSGSPPLEDMAAVMDLYLIDVQRFMNGNAEPSDGVKKKFAEIFNTPVEKLFPQNGNKD